MKSLRLAKALVVVCCLASGAACATDSSGTKEVGRASMLRRELVDLDKEIRRAARNGDIPFFRTLVGQYGASCMDVLVSKDAILEALGNPSSHVTAALVDGQRLRSSLGKRDVASLKEFFSDNSDAELSSDWGFVDLEFKVATVIWNGERKGWAPVKMEFMRESSGWRWLTWWPLCSLAHPVDPFFADPKVQ